MGLGELLLLALRVSMDAFAVSICKGLSVQKLRPVHMAQTGIWFGGFQALMPLIGYFLGVSFADFVSEVDHWIAFGLLAFLGVRMIKENFSNEEKHSFDPTRLKVILALAVATSIDALAVGISFAFIGMTTFTSILFPILIIGVVSFIMSVIGNLAGVCLGKRINLHMELWAGLILIGIGVKILIEHLS